MNSPICLEPEGELWHGGVGGVLLVEAANDCVEERVDDKGSQVFGGAKRVGVLLDGGHESPGGGHGERGGEHVRLLLG